MIGNTRAKSRLRQPSWMKEAILIGLPITCIFMVAMIIFVITMEPSVSGVNHEWAGFGDNVFDGKARKSVKLKNMLQQQQRDVKPNVPNSVSRAKAILNVPYEKMDGLQPISRTAPNQYGLVLDRPASEQAPGEQGRGIEVNPQSLSPEDLAKYESGWKKHRFNQYASDKISVQRRIRDMRNSVCWNKRYPDNLPDTSVIICFHNEALSTLLRTVYSLLNRSPGGLLREIILVDDFSSHDELMRPLETYLARLSKVKLLRAPERLGLIRARLMGYRVATGRVLTFLDSHCECSPGWLEPLLAPIANNRSMVTSPIIDPISEYTFQYQGAMGGAKVQPMIGIFDWQLLFHWAPISSREQARRNSFSDMIRSPAMPGGIFSINREFFTELGTYDSGMDIWGGENIEMSLRVWMCGGSIVTVPCSRVGHVFRESSPYDFQGVDFIKKNSIRLAEVWLDDYKVYYYDRIHYNLGDYGDVSERRALRSRLKCNTFQWYLDNIFPEMFVPSKAQASGSMIAISADVCLSGSTDLSKIELAPCTNIEDQYWVLSENGEIRRDQHCFNAAGSPAELYISSCYGVSGNIGWEYRQDNTIFHNTTGSCLEFSAKSKTVQMAPCSGGDNQVWKWSRKAPWQKTKEDFELADPK